MPRAQSAALLRRPTTAAPKMPRTACLGSVGAGSQSQPSLHAPKLPPRAGSASRLNVDGSLSNPGAAQMASSASASGLLVRGDFGASTVKPQLVPRALRRPRGAWPISEQERGVAEPPAPSPEELAALAASTGARLEAEEAEAAASSARGAAADRTQLFLEQVHRALAVQPFVYVVISSFNAEVWDPYELRIVPYTWLKVPRYRDNHFTFSSAGVTHLVKRDGRQGADFISLD